ncbi:hypothetical protein L7F22_032241 [Adiantum nelumboides]|nr:hypothetical protein [Adiantum nelumboides]
MASGYYHHSYSDRSWAFSPTWQEEGSISYEDPSGDGFNAPPGVDVQTRCDTNAEQSDVATLEMLNYAKAPNFQTRGPLTRCFVLYEDGHGYELYGSEVFCNQLKGCKSGEHSLHICDEYKSTLNKAYLHTLMKCHNVSSQDTQLFCECFIKRQLQ